MLPHFGPLELVIILVIILVLFGGGRIGKLGGELGTALREFRRGVQDQGKSADQPKAEMPDETARKD